mmetsp:Transcript_23272/g.23929  ORF Transcript_23272/g.23929 Transcript_23272/m.23929 type:complete len:365 (+) Transcript_23272:80-1174(+)
MSLVVIEYLDLLSNKDLSEDILKAYGSESIGALAIRGIPNWEEMCQTSFPHIYRLQSLSEEKLSELEDPSSMYNAGWSLGKEKMGDQPDFSKASFYFNPLADDPCPEYRDEYPWALPRNKWPLEEDIPSFKSDVCRLGSVMKDVAVLLAKHIDSLLTLRLPGYESGLFYNAMLSSMKAKARALYYYPISTTSNNSNSSTTSSDNWIAWHNDSGFLTCLAGEVFLDHATGTIIPNPEPEHAGLWIADRESQERKITIPSDCLGIQVGECLQIISGGLLVATPHCVRGCRYTPGVARVSLPCFIDTPPTFPLSIPKGCVRDDVFRNTVAKRVPPLSERWLQDGETFANFLGNTFRVYYEWNTSSKK